MALRTLVAIAELLASVLIFAIGIVVVALETLVRNKAHSVYDFVSEVERQEPHTSREAIDSYYKIRRIGNGTSFETTTAILAAGALALVAGFFAFWVWVARISSASGPGPTKPFRTAKLAIMCGVAAFISTLVVFAYATAKNNTSNSMPFPPGLYIFESQRNQTVLNEGRPGIHDPNRDAIYGNFLIGGASSLFGRPWGPTFPHYTVEFWTCGASKIAYDAPDINSMCKLSMAARWMLIPTFVLALLSTIIGFYWMEIARVESAAAKEAMANGSEKLPTIKRMQHQKDFNKVMEEDALTFKPVTDNSGPQIVKLQKPGREMK